jgi:hypothetical protein
MSLIIEFPFDRPVLLDTNVLLNAVHNPVGLASFAVMCLKKRGCPLLLSAYSELESKTVDRKHYGEDSRAGWKLAWSGVPEFIEENEIAIVPFDGGQINKLNVNKADAPIAAAAAATNSYLLSDDATLISQCRALGIEGYQPWTVARSFKGEGGFEGVSSFARYRPWNVGGGYMLARASTGGWAQLGYKVDRCLGRLGPVSFGYRGAEKAWFVDYGHENLLLVKDEIVDLEPYMIAVTLLKTENRFKARLSAAAVNGAVASKTVNIDPFPNLALATLHLGSNGADGQWSGWIQDFVAAPGSIGKTFSTYARSLDLTPNPYDDNTLRSQLRTNRFHFNFAVNDRTNITEY